MIPRPLYVAAIAYVVLLAVPMLAVLHHEQTYGGGNHWTMFGTPVDRFFQTVGMTGIMAAAIPPGFVALMGLWRGEIVLGLVQAALCATLACITLMFALTVMD